MDNLKNFATNHPQITSWIVLAIGMVIILVWSAWDVGFEPSQWVALIITTILLAGTCVWIIGWEDDEDWEDMETGAEGFTSSDELKNVKE
jgi:MFS superfamily sulfate permease-like transporter